MQKDRLEEHVNKIFGIGWAKTGTTTLGKCFEILGFDHQSHEFDLVKDIATGNLTRIIALAEKKETFEDWPWIILYKELDQAFPDSKFILTKRDPQKWVQSYGNMLASEGSTSAELLEIRRIIYGLPFPNVSKSQLVNLYEKHNTEVERYFLDRPKDLLIVNWEEGSGWEELCEFLGKDLPKEPFPHVNKGKYTKESSILRIKSFVNNFLK